MPDGEFEVESYTVRTSHSRGGSSWRALTLSSTPLYHGIRHRAVVFFYDNPQHLGVVHNVDQPNFNGHSVYANCSRGDYEAFYDLLEV